jgi:hypothetical protein
MSYNNDNDPRAKEIRRVSQTIAATEVRIRDFIDPKTAKVAVANFDGEGGDLWRDDFDNLQLKRIWPQHQPTFGLDAAMLKKFEALPCKAKKSIVAHNGKGGGLIMLLRDALSVSAGQNSVTWHPVRLPELFDVETGKLVERDAVGPGCDLWRDDLGNIQVRVRATTSTNGKFIGNIGTNAIARIRELPCTGTRSILVLGIHKDVDCIFPVTSPDNSTVFGSGYTVPRKRSLN